MDWTLLVALVTALFGGGAVGSIVGHLLTRRTAVDTLRAGELHQALEAWQELEAPLRRELGELRDRLTLTEQSLHISGERERECQELVKALTRELLGHRRDHDGARPSG